MLMSKRYWNVRPLQAYQHSLSTTLASQRVTWCTGTQLLLYTLKSITHTSTSTCSYAHHHAPVSSYSPM